MVMEHNPVYEMTPELPRHLEEATCAAIKLLERRWALCLLTVLVAGPARFSELKGAVPGVSGRMLTERLRELEGDGLVRRTIDPGPPITSTYSLTADGEGLGEILDLVRRWADSRPAGAS